ncbi:hypothetical protein J4217_01475 [Candidatus Pacearchaeota archaeon]|nr:hypothetical protein [Candidatus Pacearchaeota archaeon]
MVIVKYTQSIRDILKEKSDSLIFLENLVIDAMFHSDWKIRASCIDELGEMGIACNNDLPQWEVLPKELINPSRYANLMLITEAFAADYQIFLKIAKANGHYKGVSQTLYLTDVPKTFGDREILDQREAGNFTIKQD